MGETVRLTATNGTLSLGNIGGVSFNEGDGSDDVIVEFTGTLSDVNAALDGMAFTPAAAGPASIQISTQDEELDTDIDLIEISVT